MPRRRNTIGVCAAHGCPILTRESRCPDHQLTDYGTTHQRTRTQWTQAVAAGGVQCARCACVIEPGTPWHLDHDDTRTSYHGPSHEHCNSGART